MLGWIVWSLLATGTPVTVHTLDGQSTTGELTSLADGRLVVTSPAGPQTIPLDKLLTVTGAKRAPAAGASGEVELVDRSRLVITGYEASSKSASLTLVGGVKIDLPRAAVRWVRFHNPAEQDDKLAKQWEDITAGKQAADVLIVRKQGALDYLEGVMHEIETDSVKFELDKEIIPVKRTKVEGFIYYKAAGDELADPLGEATDVNGSKLAVRSLTLAGNSLKLETPAGLKIDWPLESLSLIDFSGGKLAFLSDLEPSAVKSSVFFSPKEEVRSLADFYSLSRDIGLERNPLKLDGKVYRKGIALHSQTSVEYRLPSKFRRLQAVVGIDDNVREGGGDVQVRINGDGRALWQGRFRGTEPAVPLDLDITGVKRLEIAVDFGGDLDVADHLDLCDAKVLK